MVPEPESQSRQFLHNPSFAMFARQCGGRGVKVSAVEALAVPGPALVEVMTDAELGLPCGGYSQG